MNFSTACLSNCIVGRTRPVNIVGSRQGASYHQHSHLQIEQLMELAPLCAELRDLRASILQVQALSTLPAPVRMHADLIITH